MFNKKQINFKYGSNNDYQQIIPDENTLYFLTDTNELYFRNGKYTKGIEIVDAIPLEGELGQIYLYNGELYCYQDNWMKITKNNEIEELKRDIEELLRRI